MKAKAKNWATDEKQIEGVIGVLLRTGVVVAAIVVLAGGVFYLAHYSRTLPSLHQFEGEPPELRSIWGIFHNAFSFHSLGVIQLGILLLIATPITRVAFSVFAFAEERDWMYVGITILVMALLLYSLLARH
jgi:uncharacterized membrane protein